LCKVSKVSSSKDFPGSEEEEEEEEERNPLTAGKCSLTPQTNQLLT